MGIEFIFLALALFVVPLSRGSYKQLLTLRFSHWWTLVLAIVGQLVLVFAPIPKSQYDTTGFVVLLATYVLLFGFCAANINIKGMWIILTGLACNAVVIALNQGMPVTSSGDYVVHESIKHQAASSADLLPWLGDIIPINALSIAISVGDIILGIGIILVCFFASRRPRASEEEIVGMHEIVDIAPEVEEVEEIGDVEHVRAVYEEDLIEVIDLTLEETADDVESDDMKPKLFGHKDEDDDFEDSIEEPVLASVASSRSEESVRDTSEKSAPIKHGLRHKKWAKTHGLAALPSKEDLGFDGDTMEVVDAAE